MDERTKKKFKDIIFEAAAITVVCLVASLVLQFINMHKMNVLFNSLYFVKTENKSIDNQGIIVDSYTAKTTETQSNVVADSVNSETVSATTEDISEKATSKKNKTTKSSSAKTNVKDTEFVYSKSSKKIHSRSCPFAKKIKDDNKVYVSSEQADGLLDKGYSFCTNCEGYVYGD